MCNRRWISLNIFKLYKCTINVKTSKHSTCRQSKIDIPTSEQRLKVAFEVYDIYELVWPSILSIHVRVHWHAAIGLQRLLHWWWRCRSQHLTSCHFPEPPESSPKRAAIWPSYLSRTASKATNPRRAGQKLWSSNQLSWKSMEDERLPCHSSNVKSHKFTHVYIYIYYLFWETIRGHSTHPRILVSECGGPSLSWTKYKTCLKN